MKKLIYTIGLMMMFSGVLQPLGGIAAEENEFSRDGEVRGLNWGQSFGETDPSKAGQDLYLFINEKSRLGPMDEAIQLTAAQYNITEDQMKLILQGSITPILEKRPTLTIEAAERIYRQMNETYLRHKKETDLAGKLKAETEPAEMFANGDLEDSGFDLIVDLNNIETILFQRNEEVTFGGSSSDDDQSGGKSDGNLPSGASGSSGPGAQDQDKSGGTSGGGSSGGGSSGGAANNLDGQSSGSEGSEGASDGTSGAANGINPNICFAEDDLEKALDRLAEQRSEEAENNSGTTGVSSNLPDNNSTDADSTSNLNNNGNSNTGGNNLGETTMEEENPPSTETLNSDSIPAASAGDYHKNPLCGEIFCLTIEFIEEPVRPAFRKTDNCIACHIEYINEGLQKTIAHNLTPSKVTGNFGESTNCKSASGIALGNIGLNVAFQAVPIQTPSKSDLMTLSSTTEEWDKFWKNNAFWEYSEDKRKRLNADYNNQAFETQSLDETSLSQVIGAAEDSPEIGKTINQTIQNVDQILQQQAQKSLEHSVGSGAYFEAEIQSALGREMKAMNGYFESMEKLFRSLNEQVVGVNSSLACTKLKNKKACT